MIRKYTIPQFARISNRKLTNHLTHLLEALEEKGVTGDLPMQLFLTAAEMAMRIKNNQFDEI